IQAAAAQQSTPVQLTPPQLGYQPVQPVSTVWQREAAERLLDYVAAIGAEGLDPAAYSLEDLRGALATGDDAVISPVADRIYLRLTADLSGGAVRGNARGEWYMPDTTIDGNQQQLLL